MVEHGEFRLIASKGKVDGEGGAETKARLSLELLAFVPALALLVGEVANSPVRRLLPQELLTGMGVRQARSLHARFIGDGTSTRAGGEAEGDQVPWSSMGSSGGQPFPARWVFGQVLRALGGWRAGSARGLGGCGELWSGARPRC